MLLRELEQRRLLGRVRPVQPADVVVLTVGVVVALLRAPGLVAGADHRHALRHAAAWRGSCASAGSVPRSIAGSSVAPSTAEVGAQVVRLAVLVVLPVGLVVLARVAHEIAQREAVVARHVVDARERLAARRLVEIAAAGEPRRELGDLAAIAAPEPAAGVAIACVPFRPARRKVSDLVAVLPEIPRLGDQLHLGRGSGPDG